MTLYLLSESHGFGVIHDYDVETHRDVEPMFSSLSSLPTSFIRGVPTTTVNFTTNKLEYRELHNETISCLIEMDSTVIILTKPIVRMGSINMGDGATELNMVIKCLGTKMLPIKNY